MANVLSWENRAFGGLNEYDQDDELILRSHQPVQGGFRQRFPVESPKLKNIDFAKGYTKRYGSARIDDFSSALVSNDRILKSIEFTNPSSNAREDISVGVKSIYIRRSGTWSQVNDENGDPFTFELDVSKVGFAFVDGKIFIGTDNGNPIQVYKADGNLDDPFYNTATSTTVDADSASGQKVLNLTATNIFKKGCRVIIDEGNANEEIGVIDSVQDGISITLKDNLTYTQTAADAHVVKNYNQYEFAYGGTDQTIDGETPLGCYLIAAAQQRLVLSNGNTQYYASDIATSSNSGVYKFSNAQNYITEGAILAIIPFTPYQTNTLNQLVYLATPNGFEINTDLGGNGSIAKITETGTIFNHQSWCTSKNWICYLTQDKAIRAINGSNVINLGRRVKNQDLTGQLDQLDRTESEASAFAFFSLTKEQAYFFYTTGANKFNDKCLVIDFTLGEPILNEPQESFERRVRLLNWEIASPEGNDWFCGLYAKREYVVGVLNTGSTYETNTGAVDLDSLAIEAYRYSPVFVAEAEYIKNQWLRQFLRGLFSGDAPITVDFFYDRSESSSREYIFSEPGESQYGSALYGTAAYARDVTLKGAVSLDRYNEAIQWRVQNINANETFTVASENLEYLQGAAES